MQKMKALILMAACVGLASPVFAAMPKVSNGMVTDAQGATLYTFDKDANGKSMCDAACSQNWPPAIADASDKASGDWGFTQTHDNQRQWTYKGHPLYRFAKDMKPGDAKGDGIRSIWHVAKP
jgi:predicted lipoprotein with Yx(FWY)xxD motif